jgi:hypothetical protein
VFALAVCPELELAALLAEKNRLLRTLELQRQVRLDGGSRRPIRRRLASALRGAARLLDAPAPDLGAA